MLDAYDEPWLPPAGGSDFPDAFTVSVSTDEVPPVETQELTKVPKQIQTRPGATAVRLGFRPTGGQLILLFQPREKGESAFQVFEASLDGPPHIMEANDHFDGEC